MTCKKLTYRLISLLLSVLYFVHEAMEVSSKHVTNLTVRDQPPANITRVDISYYLVFFLN